MNPPPPPDQTAEWVQFGINTLLGVPYSVLGWWMLKDKLRERRPPVVKLPPPAMLDFQPSNARGSASLGLASGSGLS